MAPLLDFSVLLNWPTNRANHPHFVILSEAKDLSLKLRLDPENSAEFFDAAGGFLQGGVFLCREFDLNDFLGAL